MKIAARGRFRTLVHDDNSPIVVQFTSTLSSSPETRNGKQYVSVNSAPPICRKVDDLIRDTERIEFSPFWGDKVIVKIGARALADSELKTGDHVEIHMKLGNFGPFGYCWVASNIFKI